MARWYVISPEFDYTEWVCEFGGPTYSICDVVEVEASNRSEAIVKGVKLMREWPDIARSDDKNPYVGVRAEVICPVCDEAQEYGWPYSCLICGESWLNLSDLQRLAELQPTYDRDINLATSRFSKHKRTRRILAHDRTKS